MPFGLDSNFYLKVLPITLTEAWLFWFALSSDLRTCQVVMGLIGYFWCFAALWVEINVARAYPGFDYENPEDPKMKKYRPFCDFAPWACCSKVLMSPPGAILRYMGVAKPGSVIDVPNPVLGLAFFSCHFFYPALHAISFPFLPQMGFFACASVATMTVWLAYQLFFVLKDFCIVCASMYFSNFALLPMMYKIMELNEADHTKHATTWFDGVPQSIFLPCLVLDVVMAVAVLALWLGGSHVGNSNGKVASTKSE